MKIRLRRLNEAELREAKMDGTPLVVLLDTCQEDEVSWAILEYEYGEYSAEGPSWASVEIV